MDPTQVIPIESTLKGKKIAAWKLFEPSPASGGELWSGGYRLEDVQPQVIKLILKRRIMQFMFNI